MRLLIVIVNYNGRSLTEACLASIEQQVAALPGVSVGLCDNGSALREAEELEDWIRQRGWSGWINFVRVEPNLGFTGGNNAVIRPALEGRDPPGYIMLLNNDTIAHDGAIASLLDFMESHPGVGMAGRSRLENQDGSPQISAFKFLNALSEFDRGLQLGPVSRLLSNYLVAQPTPAEASEADWVSGASMIIRRQVLDDIGLLDEGYFTYFDDIDLCRSARNRGWSVNYVPSSRVIHLVAQTTGVESGKAKGKRTPSYYLEARRRYLTKHMNPLHALACDVGFALGYSVNRLRCMITRKSRVFPEKGLLDHLRHSVVLNGFETPIVTNPSLMPNPKSTKHT